MRQRLLLPPPLRRVRNRVHIATRGRPHGAFHSIAWLSVARSGSTYLCDLLHAHPQIEAYPEIFHRKCVFTHGFAPVAELLQRKYGCTFTQPRDPELIDFVHRGAARFLADLRELSPGRCLSFKVFPGHLDPPDLRRVILADRNVAKVIFRRDPLTTFISREKALQRKQWEFADTSGVQIRVEAGAFAAYLARVNRWFDGLRHYLEDTRQPYLEITYEDLVAHPADVARLEWLIGRLGEAFPQFRTLSVPAELSLPVRRQKQDGARSLAEKISNYDEFSSGLIQRGLARFLETSAMLAPCLAAL